MIKMRTCRKCDHDKPLTDFVKKKGCKDGYGRICASCYNTSTQKYYSDNKEKVVAKVKQYAKANADTLRQKAKAYYDKNQEVMNTKAKAYYAEHREESIEKARQYRLDHKEEISKRRKEKYRALKSKQDENVQ